MHVHTLFLHPVDYVCSDLGISHLIILEEIQRNVVILLTFLEPEDLVVVELVEIVLKEFFLALEIGVPSGPRVLHRVLVN